MAELTPEKELEIAERFGRVVKARKAIVEHAGKYIKGVFKSGIIDCPVCNKPKALSYSRAGSNGHIHTHCTTKDCVSWME